MRRSPRLLSSPAARTVASTLAQVGAEIAVAAVFVVVLLAAGVHGDPRAANANAPRFLPERLDGGAGVVPASCSPDGRETPQFSPPVRAIGTGAVRCPDLRLYV
jgi:hypothetical protein